MTSRTKDYIEIGLLLLATTVALLFPTLDMSTIPNTIINEI